MCVSHSCTELQHIVVTLKNMTVKGDEKLAEASIRRYLRAPFPLKKNGNVDVIQNIKRVKGNFLIGLYS